MLESLKTDLLSAQALVKKKGKSPAAIEVAASQQALDKCLKSFKDKETAPEAMSTQSVISPGHQRVCDSLLSHVRAQRCDVFGYGCLTPVEGAADRTRETGRPV